ncbi:MAG: glycosyltransferase [Calditrichia bacterium]
MNGDSPKGFVLTCLAITISLLTFKRPYLTFHAGPYQKYFPQNRAKILTPVYKFIFLASRRIICNNDAVKEKIVGYGIKPEKIIPIQAFSVQYLKYQPVSFNGHLRAAFENSFPVIATYVFNRPEFFISRMLKAVREVVKTYPKLKLIFLGYDEDYEEIRQEINALELTSNVVFAGDQDHDSFLTILNKSHIYLRTPVKDGVSSSVLEALSLKTVVVASENYRRPPGVVTYDNSSIEDFVAVLIKVSGDIKNYRNRIKAPIIRDTVEDEMLLLTED